MTSVEEGIIILRRLESLRNADAKRWVGCGSRDWWKVGRLLVGVAVIEGEDRALNGRVGTVVPALGW